jgi:hypothetical protein
MSTQISAAKKERLRLRKEKELKILSDEASCLAAASTGTTPVVSAEKKAHKRARVEERDEKNTDDNEIEEADQEVDDNKDEGLDNESGSLDEESRKKLDPLLKPKDGDGYVNPQFDGAAHGLGPHATQNDLLELRDSELKTRNSELVTLRAQLQEIQDQRQSAAATSLTTTVVVGDTKLYQLLPGRVNADGLKSLKECLKTESRHHRVCERKRFFLGSTRYICYKIYDI